MNWQLCRAIYNDNNSFPYSLFLSCTLLHQFHCEIKMCGYYVDDFRVFFDCWKDSLDFHWQFSQHPFWSTAISSLLALPTTQFFTNSSFNFDFRSFKGDNAHSLFSQGDIFKRLQFLLNEQTINILVFRKRDKSYINRQKLM